MQIKQLDKRAFKIIIIRIIEGGGPEYRIVFEGLLDLYDLGEGSRLYAVTERGEEYSVEMHPFPAVEREDPEEATYVKPRSFYVEIPLRESLQIRFVLEESSGQRFMLVPGLGKFARLVNGIRQSYFHDKGWLMTYRKGVIGAEKYAKGRHIRCEMSYLRDLIRKGRRAVAMCRLLYYVNRIFCRRPVWLVCDRTYMAGDNGEHMFRYLQDSPAAKDNRIYFVIAKNSTDFARIKAMGPVLKYGSLRHKIKYLESRFILGSTFNELMTNVFGKTGIYYRDLRRFDFVFLRHGVSHNDQSRWINRLRLNIRLLIATCRPEYEGILSGNYGYTQREVKLTGLPRFDQLRDERQKIIAILPTWRRELQGEIDSRTLKRSYLLEFRQSNYYRFYDALIHDERLLDAMEEYGYTGEFYLHPVFEQQVRDFKGSRRIRIGEGTADYQKVFRESGIMVTDYSSVAFDFAYLKKPVIYTQFDEEAFFHNHSYGKGYFSYREDGFGPVTMTVEETVEELIQYMKRDGQMQEMYLDRVGRFFAFTDQNNCRRVYEAICEVASN